MKTKPPESAAAAAAPTTTIVELFPGFSFQPRKPIRYKPRGDRAAATPEPPPPPPPPGPANVVAAAFSGTTVNLTFDRPIVVNGNPPDESVTVNGVAPSGVTSASADMVALFMPVFVSAGEPWAINAQPNWIDTEVAWPQSGTI